MDKQRTLINEHLLLLWRHVCHEPAKNIFKTKIHTLKIKLELNKSHWTLEGFHKNQQTPLNAWRISEKPINSIEYMVTVFGKSTPWGFSEKSSNSIVYMRFLKIQRIPLNIWGFLKKINKTHWIHECFQKVKESTWINTGRFSKNQGNHIAHLSISRQAQASRNENFISNFFHAPPQ